MLRRKLGRLHPMFERAGNRNVRASFAERKKILFRVLRIWAASVPSNPERRRMEAEEACRLATETAREQR
jgi:hypothetical protein